VEMLVVNLKQDCCHGVVRCISLDNCQKIGVKMGKNGSRGEGFFEFLKCRLLWGVPLSWDVLLR
jgi:hypothetical protein